MGEVSKRASRLKGAFGKIRLAEPDKGLVQGFRKLTGRASAGTSRADISGKTKTSD